MRHKAKQRKPPKPPTKKRAAGLKEDERICETCGAVFTLAPGRDDTTYVVPAFWDGEDEVTAPTVYFDKPECKTKWYEAHKPRPLTPQRPVRLPATPKNRAPMESMFGDGL